MEHGQGYWLLEVNGWRREQALDFAGVEGEGHRFQEQQERQGQEEGIADNRILYLNLKEYNIAWIWYTILRSGMWHSHTLDMAKSPTMSSIAGEI